MNSVQVSKAQFSTQFSGSALISPPIRVTFTLSGTISGGNLTLSQTVQVPNGFKYFSDAQWTVEGDPPYNSYELWKRAPRNYYFLNEPSSPTPRIYLNKFNRSSDVLIELFLTNVAGTFTLSRTYLVHVDVFLFTSNMIN